MSLHPQESPAIDAQIREGLKELKAGNTLAALAHFEKVQGAGDDPVRSSCLGFCIAKERGQIRKGAGFCRAALAADPDNPLHALNLGRIFLLAGDKPAAVAAFREGMRRVADPALAAELEKLGTRRPLVFPALRRQHPLNRFAGFALAKLGLRKA